MRISDWSSDVCSSDLKTLNGGVGLPSGLEQVMDAQPTVPRRKLGVIAAARAACLGEDEDALLVIHESAGLGEIGRTRTGFDHEAVAPAVGAGLADDAARRSEEHTSELQSLMRS